MATPAGLEHATCRLEGGCSIQLSYGADQRTEYRIPISEVTRIFVKMPDFDFPSMRPGNFPVEAEVFRIGLGSGLQRVRFEHLIGNAVFLGIGDCLFLGVELELDLLTHVVRTFPTHQRIDLAGSVRLVIQLPAL